MKTFRAWFNPRRRMSTLALIGLIGLIVLSAGRSPVETTWFQVPDLSRLVAIVLGALALVGLALLVFGKPQAGTRKPDELRSIRAVLVLTFAVVIATQLFGPQEAVEEPPPPETEQPAAGDDVVTSPDDEMTVSGTDIAMLVLIVLVVSILVARGRRNAQIANTSTTSMSELPATGELASAIEEAHLYLLTETDPRTAVMLAYATLEQALADRGQPRAPEETPTEHLRRVLSDLPELTGPALRLGGLYELARFSAHSISEEQRQMATRELDAARESLVVAESEPA